MTVADAAWEHRASALWAEIDRIDAGDKVVRVDALVAELPRGSAIGVEPRYAPK
jgi:hypothetical protein